MVRRRFFVDEVREGHARIQGDAAHHLTRVLRVAKGQTFEISDNQNVYLAKVEAARNDLVDFAVMERLKPQEVTVRITLFASLIRFERFELLIEKATELGVEAIVPVSAERSEKGLDKAAQKRLSRWHRVAREASEQSRRARLPLIEPARDLSEALRGELQYRYLLDEAEAHPILAALPEHPTPGDSVGLLIGPEGGWTDRERSLVTAAQWRAVSLGRNILKTETAAIAALAIIQAAWQGSSAS